MSKGIPVKYDNEGNPYVETEQLNKLLAKQTEELDELRAAFVHVSNAQQVNDQAEASKRSIVGEKTEYAIADQKLTAARDWLGRICQNYIQESGMNAEYLTSGQALDVFAGTEVEEAFNKQFGMSMAKALTAYDSEYQLREALDAISVETKLNIPKSDMEKFAVIDPLKVADVDGKGYTDKEIKALERALAKEEEDGFLN